MKSAWTFLNRPLVVTLIALTITGGLLRYGLLEVFDALSDVDENLRNIDALGKLELLEFSQTPDIKEQPAKFVGQIKNHSEHTVNKVQGTICFWGADGDLADSYTGALTGVGILAPGETHSFSIDMISDRGDVAIIRIPPKERARVTMAFVDVDTLETE